LDFKITTTATTTVNELVTKLNESGDSISASLLSLGGGGVRLAVSSGASGDRGRVALDSSSLAIAFSQTVAAQDALLSVGGSSTGGGILIGSPTDTFQGAVPGVTLTVNEASRSVVNIEVTQNNDAIGKQMSAVVDQFNKMRDKLSELTAFDSGNFSSGVLFGSTEALRVDMAFSQLFAGSQSGNGSIRSIAELGISYNSQGKLEFNKQRLDAALKRDPEAVKNFLSATNTGFSAKAKAVADTLTGIKGGVLLQSTTTLQTKIELNSSRVESLNKRLDSERTRMLKQFYAMESAIAKIQSNLSSIGKIAPIATS
jgi:flagellar hook-associated protein 2